MMYWALSILLVWTGAQALVRPLVRPQGSVRRRHQGALFAAEQDLVDAVSRDVAAWGEAEECVAYEVTPSDFPSDLEGTLYRLAPARFVRRGERVNEAAGGDGMLLGVTFVAGTKEATVRAKYVSTMSLRRERREMDKAGGLTEANLSNGGLVYWAGRLFSLCDGAKPYQMDPLSLGTQKLSELGGFLPDRDDSFEAWHRVDAKRNRLVNAKVQRAAAAPLMDLFGGGGKASSQLAYFEFDATFAPLGASLTAPPKLDLQGGETVLDWALTDSKYLALTLVDDELTLRYRVRSPTSSTEANKGDILQLEGACQRAEIVNSYDDGEEFVFDVIVDATNDSKTLPRCHGELVRYVISGSVVKRTVLSSMLLGTPSVAPEERCQRHSAIYAACSDGGVARVEAESTEVWRPPVGIVGAPTLVDDKYLLALYHESEEQTKLLCFLAADLAKGPVGSLALAKPLPRTCFDGPFLSEIHPTLKEVKSAETLSRLYARKSTEWNEIEGGFSGLGIKTFLFPKGVSGG